MGEDVSFYSKNDIECPVCGTTFKREELLSGRGRLNAGELTNELRRNYIPTQKYGSINPLFYPVTVCPGCYYAADDFDFLSIPQKAIPNIKTYQETRVSYLMRIFDRVPDFTQKRDIYSGIASYILAMSCYPFFDKKKFSPTIKIGIYSLRLSWLFNDLAKETKDSKYSEIANVFYKKASEFYDLALNNQSKAIEPIEGTKNLGPDTDKNFGYDGVLYVNAVLKYKNAHSIEEPLEKLKVYEEIKRMLSKVFGIGKKAKDKPEVLLNFAREIYDKMGEDIESLQSSLSAIEQSLDPAQPEGADAAVPQK